MAIANPINEHFKLLFEAGSSPSFSLKFTKDALGFISSWQADKKKFDDAYLPADLTVILDNQAYVFEEVGVRMKGNTSRRAIYDGAGNLANLVHFKVSLKATFDDSIYLEPELQGFYHDWSEDSAGKKDRKKRNLFGLSKFDLKYIPRNDDTCRIKEVYAYQCFRDQGIMAPYANIGSLSFCDETSSLHGSYELIEPIDKDFLKRRLSKSEASGDLYKCVYNAMGKADLARDGAITKTYDKDGFCDGVRVSNGKIGVEDNFRYYSPCYQLKTNDDLGEESDFSKMANFVAGIWNVVYADAGKDYLKNLLDVDEFLSYAAVSYLLGNFDDCRYNYNNYYIYFLPSTGKAIYIPYDYDWCLGSDIYLGEKHLNDVEPFGTETLDGGEPCNIYYATLLNEKRQGSNLSYDKEDFRLFYLNAIKSMKDSVLSPASFASLAKKLGEEGEVPYVSGYMAAKKAAIGA